MKKFQIFLFIEACLLTGALILMVSEHFSRFLLILFLFLLLIRYYTGKEGNNFLLLVATILFFFIVMLNPFVILAIFVAVIKSMAFNLSLFAHQMLIPKRYKVLLKTAKAILI